MRAKTAWLRSILIAAALWAATRLAYMLIGIYSYRLDWQPVPWADMWVQWDAAYYLSIAGNGYQVPTVVTGLETGASNINFFPMTSILTAGAHLLVPSLTVAGIIAANLCLLLAAIVLHRLASRRFSADVADWSLISLMTLPGSFAFSSPLSESPFLLFSVTAAYFGPRRYGRAAFSSAFLTITRWTGMLQGFGFAIDWMVDRLRGREASYQRLLSICLIPLPLMLFLLYMYHLTGDGFAPLHSNVAFWHQHFEIPFQSLFLFVGGTTPRLEIQSTLALVLIALTLSQAFRFSWGEVAFVVLSVASFASSDAASASLVRYTIGLYPVHLALGNLCSRHAPMRLVLLVFAMAGAATAQLWFHGSSVYV